MEKLLLTVHEAQEVTGFSRSRLYDLADQGEIRLIRIGKAVRIPAASLRAYVDRLEKGES